LEQPPIGEKNVVFFHILYCSKGPLIGKQWVRIYGEETVREYKCVVAFKREYLKFVDQLAFERHTFIVFEEKQIIRLQRIRNLLICPMFYKTPSTKRKGFIDVIPKYKIAFSTLIQETLVKMAAEHDFGNMGVDAKIVYLKRETNAKLNSLCNDLFAKALD